MPGLDPSDGSRHVVSGDLFEVLDRPFTTVSGADGSGY
jgi:hypothetical protein